MAVCPFRYDGTSSFTDIWTVRQTNNEKECALNPQKATCRYVQKNNQVFIVMQRNEQYEAL